ncbi:MAG: hypothetical protein H8Z69_00255 [Nanohaloarchaea archaeon]|nr:hypothetical protein [Candidatus Nanohaloarchaea archaeon]
MKMIKAAKSRFSKLSASLVLVFLGFAISFVLEGYMTLLPGFLMSVPAILLVSSSRTDSVKSAVAGFLFGSWFMLVLVRVTAPVLVALFICFFYFMFRADQMILLELYETGNVGLKSEENREK